MRGSQLSTSGKLCNSETHDHIESAESLQAMELCDRLKGIKRMRLSSDNDGSHSCMWDHAGLGLEDECMLPLVGLGHTSGVLGRTAAMDGTACPRYTVGTACMDGANSLGRTICLPDSATIAGSWTSVGSIPIKDLEKDDSPAVELGLGLTIMPAISGVGSALTSVCYFNINHIDRSGESSLPDIEHLQKTTSVMVEDILETNKGFYIENDLEMQRQSGMSSNSAGIVKSDQASSSRFLHRDCRLQTTCSDGSYILPPSMSHQVGRVPSSEAQRFQSNIVVVTEATSEADVLMSLKTSSGATSTSVTSSGLADRAPKMCRFIGCGKRVRGASCLCTSHGGGRRCQKQGCNKGAEGHTIFCKAHGGGRRCETLGCTKSAEGKTDHCIGHGGGSRCSHDECDEAAGGRTGFCIRHGVGKRCQREGCANNAESYSALCILHGGGKQCQYPSCGKGAQGSTMFCKGHGGGKRCKVEGCNRGAEGNASLCKGHGGGKRCMFDGGGVCPKSVHGGSSYCVAHESGKRCAVQGCTKSARGRTVCCVRHGGGKPCKSENCFKSAQGNTNFCKAHGGGKICSWDQEGSIDSGECFQDKTWDFFKGSCDRTAKGKLGLCAAHSALLQDRRVHGTRTFGSTFPAGALSGEMPQSVHKKESFLSSFNASKQLGTAMEDDVENSSESPLEASTSSGASRGEQDGMEEDTCPYPQLALFPSRLAVRASQGLTFNSSLAFGLRKEMSETDPMLCPFISSQVFGPLSMQRCASGRKQELGQKGFSNLEDDGVFNMSSLFLPDERIHGGNIMALLSGEASK